MQALSFFSVSFHATVKFLVFFSAGSQNPSTTLPSQFLHLYNLSLSYFKKAKNPQIKK